MDEFTSAKFLDPLEDAKLWAKLKAHDSRDTLILSILRLHGMRPSELLALRPSDLNDIAQTIRVKGLKGSQGRELPLPANLYLRLKDEARGRGADQKIFNISYRRLAQVWDFYRPSNKTLRSLRHGAAVRVYRQTKDIQLVQRVLGHTSIENTLKYQTFSYTQDEFKKVFINQTGE